MAGPARPSEPEHVACAVCLKEIPASVAKSLEGPDYVHHFCGLDCYEEWRKRQTSNKGPDTPRPE